MKDSKGTELEVGQKVLVMAQTGLRSGTINRIRQKTTYRRTCPVARVLYDIPEDIYQKRVVRSLDGTIQYQLVNGYHRAVYETVLARTHREKEFYNESKIWVLDNSTE